MLAIMHALNNKSITVEFSRSLRDARVFTWRCTVRTNTLVPERTQTRWVRKQGPTKSTTTCHHTLSTYAADSAQLTQLDEGERKREKKRVHQRKNQPTNTHSKVQSKQNTHVTRRNIAKKITTTTITLCYLSLWLPSASGCLNSSVSCACYVFDRGIHDRRGRWQWEWQEHVMRTSDSEIARLQMHMCENHCHGQFLAHTEARRTPSSLQRGV